MVLTKGRDSGLSLSNFITVIFMKTIKKRTYGDVTSWEMGFGYIGRPMMTSIFYLLDHVVIDTGSAHLRRDVVDLLEEYLPSRVLLTHCHEDHAANARAICDRFQIDAMGHPYTVYKMAAKQIILPYQRLVWGKSEQLKMKEVPEVVETDRYRLKSIFTPGHSRDHMVYLEEENGWLFSGDIYLADRIKYFRADENLISEIDSLKKILKYDFEVLFCGHNPQLNNGKKRLQAKLDHLEDFAGTVQALVKEGVPEQEIINRLDNGGGRFMKWITMGNMSFANMVRSAIRNASESM